TPGAGGCSLGWIYSSPNWTLCSSGNGGGGTPGTFYISGNAGMNSDIGSATWKATIITTGSINIAHSMSIHCDDLTATSTPPSLNPLLPTETLLVAGTDIKMTGAVGFSYHGMVAAHEQIDLTNQTQLSGILIAENMGSTGNLVTANKIEGAVDLSYDCTL